MNDNIMLGENVSLPFPLGARLAFPLDSRFFFSNIQDARKAVRNAVRLERDSETGFYTLPGEFNEDGGGADSEYYYGQPIVVSGHDGSTASLYLVVRAEDEHGEPYGDLMNVCDGLDAEYLLKEEAPEYIEAYINENLNAECFDDYLFTGGVDECEHPIPSTGLYAFGLGETNGVLHKCESYKKVLSFDPTNPYDKNVNPLATMDSVRNFLDSKVDKEEGYGLSQNDFSDCLLQKLLDLPTITIEGDKIIINGKEFKLQEWYDVMDYYVGWMNLSNRSSFLELTKEELLNSVKNSGFVPPEGKLYGKDTACGYNTFFLMKRKHIDIDEPYLGEYSEWESNGVVSPIRSDSSSLIVHNDVFINDEQYDVYGLHTAFPNPSDTVQIALSTNIVDYYVLYGTITFDNTTERYKLYVDGVNVPFDDVTGTELLSLAESDEDFNGYVVSNEKSDFVTKTHGTVQCDYQREITDIDINAMFIAYRNRGANIPSLGFVIGTNIIGDDVVYNRVIPQIQYVDNFNTVLSRDNIVINGEKYTLKTLYDPHNLAGNVYGINFQK